MPKIDFKKVMKTVYHAPAGKPAVVEIPPIQYIMVDGRGHPEEKNFQDAAGTIFPAAWVLKFLVKEKNPEKDFVVMPMEVKWYLDRTKKGSERYRWTMMIMQPGFITESLFHEAVEKAKMKTELPCEDSLRLETLQEGLCAQILHIGPYGNPMEETFAILKKCIASMNYHHEADSHDIYFNNILKTPPEKLRTLIRVKIITGQRR